MSIINLKDIVGCKFLVPQDDGEVYHACIVAAIEDYTQQVQNDPVHVKFRCSLNEDAYEEILSYNQIMDYLDKDMDDPIYWQFKRITAH